MAAKPLPRPRQVSFSGWSIIAGSVLTILFAFQRVAALGSIEAQESAADFISTPPGDGLGLSIDEVQLAIRIMCLVAGGTAAATAILGWHVMAPSRSARVVLSVLAPILFVAGLTSGGLFSALVAAGVVMLWVQPARDFFDGKEPSRTPAPAAARSGGSASASGSSYPPGTSGEAPPPSGSSWDLPPPQEAPRGQISGQGAAPAETMGGMSAPGEPSVNPYGAPPPPYGAVPPPGAGARPGRVTAAAVITIVASGVTLAGLLVATLFFFSSRAELVDEIEQELAGNSAYDNISAETLTDVSIAFMIVAMVWCVAAIILAVVMMRGSNAARITLIVSASLSALVSLLGALVLVPIVLTIASIVTVVLLLTGGSGQWFASRKKVG